jgi:hypothetical protein
MEIRGWWLSMESSGFIFLLSAYALNITKH